MVVGKAWVEVPEGGLLVVLKSSSWEIVVLLPLKSTTLVTLPTET